MKIRIGEALIFVLLLAPVLAAADPVTESPTGQLNVEVLNARDQNVRPTPAPNYLKLDANDASGIVLPTPAAGECVIADEDLQTSTDKFTVRCTDGLHVFNLHLLPGSATAGRAPLYLSSGPLLPTPEPGAMEYLNHTLYFTTYLVRRSVMLNQDIVTADATVTNTTAETTVYSIPMAANYLTVGKVIIPKLYGIYSSGGGRTFTLRLKYAGSTVISIQSDGGTVTNAPWYVHFPTTIRAVGASGSAISMAVGTFNNADKTTSATGTTAIDTTVPNTLTVTVQWSAANASDAFTVQQGYTDCVQ